MSACLEIEPFGIYHFLGSPSLGLAVQWSFAPCRTLFRDIIGHLAVEAPTASP